MCHNSEIDAITMKHHELRYGKVTLTIFELESRFFEAKKNGEWMRFEIVETTSTGREKSSHLIKGEGGYKTVDHATLVRLWKRKQLREI